MPKVQRKVLVVEDEVLVAMLIEDMIIDLGHQVVGPVGSLAEGMKIARSSEIDFAVVDINLNGEKSYPIADILKHRGIPFIFITGYDVRRISDELADVLTVQKPFDILRLQQAIQQFAT